MKQYLTYFLKVKLRKLKTLTFSEHGLLIKGQGNLKVKLKLMVKVISKAKVIQIFRL